MFHVEKKKKKGGNFDRPAYITLQLEALRTTNMWAGIFWCIRQKLRYSWAIQTTAPGKFNCKKNKLGATGQR